MSDEKQLAKDEVKRPDTQKLLRQFLKVERGLARTNDERRGWDFWHLSEEEQQKVLRLAEELDTDWMTAFDMYREDKDSGI